MMMRRTMMSNGVSNLTATLASRFSFSSVLVCWRR